MYKRYVKRLLDIILSIFAMPFFALILLFIAPAIYFEDHGPIFYRAKRRGCYGKVFQMLKFRSMKVNAPDLRNADNSTFNSADDPRITKVGQFIRKTSIDEIPQILNVLKGDMSLIGPRASIPIEGIGWEDLSKMQQKRLTVKPGITGYTAAIYRNSISQEEKRKWDCYYVDNMSFIMDLNIFLWTIKAVLLRKNVYTNDNNKTIDGRIKE